MAKRFIELAVSDLANQFAIPLKSATGAIVSRRSAAATKHVSEAVVDRLQLHPDSRVLEIGYGRGHGLAAALKAVPHGAVFGLEKSPYMEEVAHSRFILEAREDRRLQLDRVFDLRHLAYPTDFFDGIFHVDLYYFIKQESMLDVSRELLRCLQPGGKLLCGLQMERLRKLQRWGLLASTQWDPLRYLSELEPAGFIDVKMEYVPTPRGEIQVISAAKPPAGEGDEDPAERMRQLELSIKREWLRQRVVQGGGRLTKEELDIVEGRSQGPPGQGKE